MSRTHDGRSALVALLGPTNTGKTHRAVEHMLDHETGMIGFPLRLLAREVYDRITARVGENAVALVTGEEKRIPESPRYWVCTVESMPVSVEVDFLAIDEIQLAARPQRGHVFTDRLLNARGRRATWFMGSDTMRDMVSELLPTARIESHPRLSQLRHAGTRSLSGLPARSAVVAFSAQQVYELAERLRQRRGGAAVVLGALSPRTRNAQVAMYQAGEVDYMVATDAIGMGLNMDVDHVAFGALSKFDGREGRYLEPAELAQIAGRAGRFERDGTFGTIKEVGDLPPGVVHCIESHRFSPVQRIYWRNSDLNLTSVDELLAGLRRKPSSRRLRMVPDAPDYQALVSLLRDDDIRDRAVGEAAVSLLWDVCRIPDFRKQLLDVHTQLLGDIFRQLASRTRRLDPDWMSRRIARIDDTDGDIHVLMSRIAFIRTWTYVSNHERWVVDASQWQERTREVENRLSDALHERLTQRFVEEKGGGGRATPGRRRSRRRRDPPVSVSPDHPFAGLDALNLPEAPGEEPDPEAEERAFVETVVEAGHRDIQLSPQGELSVEERVVGRLSTGKGLLHPHVKVVGFERAGAGATSRVERRLAAFVKDAVSQLGPADCPDLGPAARGLVYQLEQGLGTVTTRTARAQMRALRPQDRERLADIGVTCGRLVAFGHAAMRSALRPLRVALWCAANGAPDGSVPGPGAVSFEAAPESDPFYTALGFPVFAGRAIRADILNRVDASLFEAAGGAGMQFAPPVDVLRWFSAPRRQIRAILRAMGYRQVGKTEWVSPGRTRRPNRRAG